MKEKAHNVDEKLKNFRKPIKERQRVKYTVSRIKKNKRIKYTKKDKSILSVCCWMEVVELIV